MMRILAFLLVLCGAAPAMAQSNNAPKLPAPLQNLADEGVQIQYLGHDHGFDGWVTFKGGQEQYFYVPKGGSGFVSGILYDNDGRIITLRQVQKLQTDGDPDLLDTLTDDTGSTRPDANSPSERLFYDIENSNWVAFGQAGAPVAYAFIDPQCPHCHAMINDMRAQKLFENGQLQLRSIPVGFRDETRAQAAFLMATPDAQNKFFDHLDGVAPLPARDDINQQGVERNLAIMQSWQFDVTPLIIYRAADGTVKLVRGRIKNLDAFVADLQK